VRFSLTCCLLAEDEEEEHQQQESNNSKLLHEHNQTGIKTETVEIKEEHKLMTTAEDVSEKLGN